MLTRNLNLSLRYLKPRRFAQICCLNTFKQLNNHATDSSTLSYKVSDTQGLSLEYDTLSARLSQLARSLPDQECYVFKQPTANSTEDTSRHRFKFAHLRQRVHEFAQNLLNLGFVKGDRLAVMLPNVPELVISTLACAHIGLVCVLMNPHAKMLECEHVLANSRAKGLLIVDDDEEFKHYHMLTRISPELDGVMLKGELELKRLKHLRHVFVVDMSGRYESVRQKVGSRGTWSFGEMERFDKAGVDLSAQRVESEDPFVLVFTVIIYVLRMIIMRFLLLLFGGNVKFIYLKEWNYWNAKSRFDI
jgi:long-subunit acyl-CoA synthetase (AMP-forming)